MKNILILQKKGLKRISHIKVSIEDKETGLMSEGVDVVCERELKKLIGIVLLSKKRTRKLLMVHEFDRD